MYLPGADDSPEKSTSSKPDDRYGTFTSFYPDSRCVYLFFLPVGRYSYLFLTRYQVCLSLFNQIPGVFISFSPGDRYACYSTVATDNLC